MIKAIAIDDEPLALSVIEQFCERCGDIELNVFSDPVAGLSSVNSELPDLVFLDIEMNGISGMDIAKSLPDGVFLIFTTAYARFALEGFELNAVDFLHKPFSYQRFQTSVDRVRERIRMKKLSEEISGKDSGELTVKSEYKNINIRISDIQYLEAMDNYVKIHLSSGDPVLTQISLKEIYDSLPEDGFARIHKSYVVSLKKVVKYTRKSVELSYRSAVLPVGRVYADEFIRKIVSVAD